MNGYTLLALTIVFELVGTTSLKLSEGFTRPLPSLMVVVGYTGTFYLLSRALLYFPLGTAYAIWAGLGTAGTVIIGILVWNEAVTPTRIIAIVLIIAGVVMLNLGGAHSAA